MLDLTVELFAFCSKLFLPYLGLLFQYPEIFLCLVSRAIGISCKLDSLLYIFLLGFKLMLKFWVNILHCVLFLSKLIYLFPQFIVIGGKLIQLLIGSHQFIFEIFYFLEGALHCLDATARHAWLLALIIPQPLSLFLSQLFLNCDNLLL